MNNSYITIIKEKRTVLSRKRVPLNQNECTADFRIGVPSEQNLQTMFKEFHALLLGKDETKLDEYLEKYGASEIESFCNGIKRDITPVKNAISLSVNSGFVEGNNNKFKVLKRIVYGRSGLVNLEKKCKLAFLPKNQDFSLSALL